MLGVVVDVDQEFLVLSFCTKNSRSVTISTFIVFKFTHFTILFLCKHRMRKAQVLSESSRINFQLNFSVFSTYCICKYSYYFQSISSYFLVVLLAQHIKNNKPQVGNHSNHVHELITLTVYVEYINT